MKELIIKIKFWFISKFYIWFFKDSIFAYDITIDVFTIRGQKISGAYFKMLEEVDEEGDIYELIRINGVVTFKRIEDYTVNLK